MSGSLAALQFRSIGSTASLSNSLTLSLPLSLPLAFPVPWHYIMLAADADNDTVFHMELRKNADYFFIYFFSR